MLQGLFLRAAMECGLIIMRARGCGDPRARQERSGGVPHVRDVGRGDEEAPRPPGRPSRRFMRGAPVPC